MGKKVLITGSEGFIGKHLHKLYPDADCIDKALGTDILDNLPDKNYDIVFHLAACHHIASGEANPEKFILTNCWGTTKLMRTYPNSRFINISSSAASKVQSVYGATKAFTELIGNTHNNCLSVRFYNVFGEGQLVEGGAFTPKLILHWLNGDLLSINGDGFQSRDFTYVGDVVLNLQRLAESERTGLAHIGYGKSISIIDMIKLVYTYMPSVSHNPALDFDIRYSQSPEPCEVFYGRELGMERTKEWFANEYSKTRNTA